jgi:hypothetical protein
MLPAVPPTPASAQINRPWWTEWGLLLVVGLPALTILACAVTVTIAVKGRDGVVSEDYYRQGLAINQSLKRDEVAAKRGLSATLSLDSERQRIQVQVSQAHGETPSSTESPERQHLRLELINAVHPERDQRLILSPERDGRWFAEVPGVAPGPWDIVLEGNDWRLRAQRIRLGGDPQFLMPHPSGIKP